MLARCRGRFEVIVLSVFATNGGAKRLYRSRGFQPASGIPQGVRRHGTYIDLEWMTLRL